MRMDWLAWTTGLLPVAGVAACAYLSMRLGLIPSCNPLLDGCTSISATGRTFPADLLFRAFILPTAVFTGLFWFAAWYWLRRLGAAPGAALHFVPACGLLAAIFLVVYVSFLGTDGDVYRFMRRFGVFHYFAFTYLAQLLMVRAMYRLPAVPIPERRWMLLLCSGMLVIGMAAILLDLARWDTTRIDNIIEWNGSLLLMAVFWLCAVAWRRTRYRLVPETRRPGARGGTRFPRHR